MRPEIKYILVQFSTKGRKEGRKERREGGRKKERRKEGRNSFHSQVNKRKTSQSIVIQNYKKNNEGQHNVSIRSKSMPERLSHKTAVPKGKTQTSLTQELSTQNLK